MRIDESQQKDRSFETFLHEKIRSFNNDTSSFFREVRKPGSIQPIYIYLRDDEENLIGGLVASTYWDWMDIEDFFIPGEHRGQGLGTEILQRAEHIAKDRGCLSVHLTTYEFQARSFYERNGYSVVGQLENYPPGTTYYWMRKDFDTSGS